MSSAPDQHQVRTLQAKDRFKVNYHYYLVVKSLGDITRLQVTPKVLLENLQSSLDVWDGSSVAEEDIHAGKSWLKNAIMLILFWPWNIELPITYRGLECWCQLIEIIIPAAAVDFWRQCAKQFSKTPVSHLHHLLQNIG